MPGVIYVGSLSLSDTHRLIAESFALVNSSLSEGVATAVLEVVTLKMHTHTHTDTFLYVVLTASFRSKAGLASSPLII